VAGEVAAGRDSHGKGGQIIVVGHEYSQRYTERGGDRSEAVELGGAPPVLVVCVGVARPAKPFRDLGLREPCLAVRPGDPQRKMTRRQVGTSDEDASE
jgi:hypothetical protein